MIFTSRTYRHAIRRSIFKEFEIKNSDEWREGTGQVAIKAMFDYHTQVNHTRRLQARKRKERK